MGRRFFKIRIPALLGRMPPIIAQRERLRMKLLGAIRDLAQALETTRNYVEAITCYQKGIEAEPFAEAF
jgi:hypothetical protein